MTKEAMIRVGQVLQQQIDPSEVTLEELQAFAALLIEAKVAAENTL